MGEPPVVDVQHVTFSYNGHRVLDDSSFVIEPLDFMGIVGPNGGGKTTLLRLMLGLIKPKTGTIRLFGERPEATRHRVGYVPQSFRYDPQFPVSVLDVVLAGRLGLGHTLGPYERADRAAARESIESVDCGDLADRPFDALSGGQRQRILIARAIASKPDALMLDEPTANVDAAVEEEFLLLLKELNKTMTIVMVSHDLAFVSGVVKNVLCVHGHVGTHPTSDVSDITAEFLKKMYGRGARAVRHDLGCKEGGKECSSS
jgi:zinc transport system ATP-binding protein